MIAVNLSWLRLIFSKGVWGIRFFLFVLSACQPGLLFFLSSEQG
jgi:hypothetical protein